MKFANYNINFHENSQWWQRPVQVINPLKERTNQSSFKWNEDFRFCDSNCGKIFEFPIKSTKESKYNWLHEKNIYTCISFLKSEIPSILLMFTYIFHSNKN